MLCFDGSLHSSSLDELPKIPEANASLGECVIDLSHLSSGRLVSPSLVEQVNAALQAS